MPMARQQKQGCLRKMNLLARSMTGMYRDLIERDIACKLPMGCQDLQMGVTQVTVKNSV